MDRPNKGQIVDEKVVIIFIIITMLLVTFLSCMYFSYELLDFLGMATRESRHAIFVSYRLLNFLKTCASVWNPPQKNHRTLISAMDLPTTQIIFNILFKIFGYVKNSLYLCSEQLRRGRE